MYKDVLRSIEGISVFPVISLVIFVAIFAGMLVWVFRLREEYINEMGNLPLEEDSTDRDWEGGRSDDRS